MTIPSLTLDILETLETPFLSLLQRSPQLLLPGIWLSINFYIDNSQCDPCIYIYCKEVTSSFLGFWLSINFHISTIPSLTLVGQPPKNLKVVGIWANPGTQTHPSAIVQITHMSLFLIALFTTQ